MLLSSRKKKNLGKWNHFPTFWVRKWSPPDVNTCLGSLRSFFKYAPRGLWPAANSPPGGRDPVIQGHLRKRKVTIWIMSQWGVLITLLYSLPYSKVLGKPGEIGEQAEGAASIQAAGHDGHRGPRTWNKLVQPEQSGRGSVCKLSMLSGLRERRLRCAAPGSWPGLPCQQEPSLFSCSQKRWLSAERRAPVASGQSNPWLVQSSAAHCKHGCGSRQLLTLLKAGCPEFWLSCLHTPGAGGEPVGFGEASAGSGN